MKLWVDDEREAPPGWAWVKNSEEAIKALANLTFSEMSLDYVLGRGDNGGVVLEWLKDHADRKPPVIRTHSSSHDGNELMKLMISELLNG